MTKHKNTKAAKVMEMLNKGMSNKEIMERFKVSYSYLWLLRKKMVHLATHPEEVFELTPEMAEFAHKLTQGKGRRKAAANDTQEGGDHYKQMPVEPWDIYDSWPAEQRIGAYRANCVKYVLRLEHKDSRVLNARKLKHYASKLVEVAEELEAKEK